MKRTASRLSLFGIILMVITACSIVPAARISVPEANILLDSSLSTITAEAPAVHTVASLPVLTVTDSSQTAAIDLEKNLIQVYQRANSSVVYILTASGSGSGFVYSQAGDIVTNNHVVAGGQDFEVVFASGERQRASLIGADTDSDLAVIRVEQLPDGVQPLGLAEHDNLQVGQFVVAIGNPFGEQGSMSWGIVSGLGRNLPSQRSTTTGSTYSLPEVIQTDAPINPGNSGGPLLNLQGQVVGVNAAIATTSGSNSGVGFSIPVNAVRLIVPELIASGNYNYPYMGVSFDGEISLSDEAVYDLKQTLGAYVLSITPGSPADQAGLRAANPSSGQGGDLVIAIDGQEIQDFADLNSFLVFHTRIGQTIQITVLRAGEQVTLPLSLGARP